MGLLLVCLLAPGLAKPPPPVAMVLHAGQGATVKCGEEAAKALRDMDLLRAGDVVVAGKEPVRLVVLDDGHGESIRPGKKATLARTGCSPAAAVVKVKRQRGAAALAGLRERARSDKAGGAVVRGNGGSRSGVPGLVSPLPDSCVLVPRPTFRWPAVKGALRYEFALYQGERADGTLLWKRQTREPTLPWPKGRPPLPAGAACYWDVVVLLPDDQWEKVVTGLELTVPTADQQQEFDELAALARSDDSDTQLLAAVLYEERHAYDAALSLYQKVERKRPETPGVLLALFRLHKRAGDRAGAEAIRKRLMKPRTKDDGK
jgi:hypothetical protein